MLLAVALFWGFRLPAVTGPANAQTNVAQALYATHCADCHGANAAALAHDTLLEQSGTVWTRSRKSELPLFLERHGRLSSADAASLSEYLLQSLRNLDGKIER